jgi:hypothetical protein
VVLVDLEGHAGIDTAQYADKAILDVIAAGDFTGQLVLPQSAGVNIADLTAQPPGQAQGSGLESGADLFAMLSEVLEEDAVGPEIILQPERTSEVP